MYNELGHIATCVRKCIDCEQCPTRTLMRNEWNACEDEDANRTSEWVVENCARTKMAYISGRMVKIASFIHGSLPFFPVYFFFWRCGRHQQKKVVTREKYMALCCCDKNFLFIRRLSFGFIYLFFSFCSAIARALQLGAFACGPDWRKCLVQ